ncbi:transferase [Syncephalis pseudoplumigaleata]|uniref:Transferase n=1 Tax=Syncephalis pseudoplumigaleata TaxID=1712513 RepID=A0A4P9Z1Y6_9FUNG|nr:transferase [Syncephalis pseudoplumigaleata]|eukprot:RKP26503.1 transferase [Syncephalis pseudoplumigaleata]
MTVDATVEYWLAPTDAATAQAKYQLSDTDDIPGPHTHRLFFYKNHARKADFMPTEKLVAALRKIIDQYPIIAGRIVCTEDGALEVHPSAKGVHYRESHTADDIALFEPDWPQSSMRDEWAAVSWLEGEDVAFAVHVVRFANNSGVLVCQSGHHQIADGTGWSMLLRAWAAFARGETPPPPEHNRHLLRLGPTERHLVRKPSADKPSWETIYLKPVGAVSAIILRFSADSIARLKQDAVDSLSEEERRTSFFSTNDVVCSVLWRAFIRSRRLPHEQRLAKQTPRNMRAHLHDVPSHYFGNAIDSPEFVATAGELLDSSLGRVALRHREAVHGKAFADGREWIKHANAEGVEALINRETVWKNGIDFLTTDWSRFGYYKQMDFGDGNPVSSRRLVCKQMSITTIMESPPSTQSGNGRSLDVSVAIDTACYERMIADDELAKYITVIG